MKIEEFYKTILEAEEKKTDVGISPRLLRKVVMVLELAREVQDQIDRKEFPSSVWLRRALADLESH